MYTQNDIKKLLEENDRAVMRAIVAIYNFQTQEEQTVEATLVHNGVGFNGADANFMSSLAKQIIERNSLSPKQLTAGRKCIMKYAGQLVRIANYNLEKQHERQHTVSSSREARV